MHSQLIESQNMKVAGYVVIAVLSLITNFSTVASTEISKNLPAYSKVYDDQADPFKDAGAAIKLAQKTNRNVLIEIGGNWCTWCHKMDAFLEQNPDIYQMLHQKYVLLKVNVSDSNENEAFMKSLPPVLGYPHMYVSTASGKMVLSKDTAELLNSGKYSREAWIQFLTKWQVDNNSEHLANISSKVATE